jgi:hypothetical protein
MARPETKDSIARCSAGLVAALCLLVTHASAATLPFTVTTSEPVTVTGTPRIAIDVGGITRYASYAAGSGTAALTFTYAVQSGDFDANGITLVAPVDLNGGNIADIAGNPASGLTFTLPDTSALKVQTYTAAFTTSPITETNANAVSFAIAKAPTGADFTYAITSDGGSGSVTGSGTISGSPHNVANVDVSNLPSGTLTLSVTVSTADGGTGGAKTATATPAFTGVLDSLPAAAAAFSLRRLAGAYPGPLIRVRRSADNAQQDIGATVGGTLDAASLTGFCGASSCFTSIWYDQSGNGQDAVQATQSNQPRIVDAGTVETDGGRPALRYTAAGPFLEFPAMPSQTNLATLNAVARVADAAAARHVMGNRSAAGGRIIRAVSGGGSYLLSNINAGTVSLAGSTLQQRIVTMVSSPLQLLGALDGITTTNGANFIASSAVFHIGRGGPVQSPSGDWIGTISEAAVFNYSMSTADRLTLERNQGAYFGIIVP